MNCKSAFLFILAIVVVVISEETNNKTTLTISVLVPLSSRNLDGRPYLPALDLALELINNRTDILTDYNLEAVVSDSAVSRCMIIITLSNMHAVAFIGENSQTCPRPLWGNNDLFRLVLLYATVVTLNINYQHMSGRKKFL